MIKNNIKQQQLPIPKTQETLSQNGDERSTNTKSTKLNKAQKKILKEKQQETEKQRQNDYFFSDTPLKQIHIVAKIHPKIDKKYKPDCHDQICIMENLCQDTSCLALFDAHGKCGKSVAVDLNQIFSQHMQTESRKVAWMSSWFHFDQFLTQTFQITQKKLKNSLMNYDETGASAVVAIIKKNRLFISNIGNSKAILFRKQNKKDQGQMCLVLSEEHDPQQIEEHKRIKTKKGKIYKSVNKDGKPDGPYKIWKDDFGDEPGIPITRSFGNYFAEKIGSSCKPFNNNLDLQPIDKYLVLASDGLLNLLEPNQICGLINKYLEENQEFYKDGIEEYIVNYCESLIKNKKYKQDKYGFNTKPEYEDISFVIVFFNFDAKPLPFQKKTQFSSSLLNEKAVLKKVIDPQLCYDKIDLKAIQTSKQPLLKEVKMFERQIKNLKGNQIFSIIGGIFPFGVSIMTLPLWSQTLNLCTGLSQTEKDIITLFPLISGSFGRLIQGMQISKYGGKSCSLLLSSISLTGVLMLLLVNVSYEYEGINSSQFSFYILSLAGFSLGAGVSTFQLVANAVFWSPVQQAGTVQGIQAGAGNSMQGIYGLVVINLLKYIEIGTVYIITVIVMATLISVSYFLSQDPLNMQLRRQKMEESDAKIVAEYLGQKNFATELNFQKCLKDVNCIIFILNYIIGFGGFLTISTYIQNVVTEYHQETPYVALTQVFIFIMLTSFARMVAGPLSDKYGGYLVTQISLLCLFIGSLFEVLTPQGNGYAPTHIIGLIFYVFAFGPSQASVFKWIVEIEYSQYTTVSTLAGTFGGAASFFMKISVIQPISQQGTDNMYLGFLFFLIASLLLIFINVWQQKIRLKQ